jgi:predicted 2-oxoglutarate/Fe(II)-dependent dioxygenase YbiX
MLAGWQECRDIFIVKYQAPLQDHDQQQTGPQAARQSGLALHTDGSIISFNVLLSEPVDFDGGGTFFSHLGRVVAPDQGEAVVHDGKKQHAGVPITRGVRYLLVGFVEVSKLLGVAFAVFGVISWFGGKVLITF